nr:PREDICTED: regenerating islet-derived protein 4 [Anolis carolinensis]|eukprot:XP_016852684.1 PREDICTED: regenerating islet-derived protein 4 [Anolis carolinensis]
MEASSHFHFSILSLLFFFIFLPGSQGMKCKRGWFPYEQNCYGLFPELKTWNHAEIECMSYGRDSHLASIFCQREMDAVATWLTTNFNIDEPIWIGLYNVGSKQKKRWRWSDMSSANYIPWGRGESSSLEGDCVEMSYEDFSAWRVQNCEVPQAYLCKVAMM